MKNPQGTLRVFFAIDPPDLIKNTIRCMIQQMQQLYQLTPVRWLRPDDLHITLQFLQEIATHDVPKLIEHARNELKSKRSFPITLKEIELFPTPYKPRVISIKVEPQDLLTDLAKALGCAIQTTGYATETRPFRGHLTLGRIKESRHLITLQEYQHPPIPSFRANSLTLYRSEPDAKGSHYHVLKKFYLQ